MKLLRFFNLWVYGLWKSEVGLSDHQLLKGPIATALVLSVSVFSNLFLFILNVDFFLRLWAKISSFLLVLCSIFVNAWIANYDRCDLDCKRCFLNKVRRISLLLPNHRRMAKKSPSESFLCIAKEKKLFLFYALSFPMSSQWFKMQMQAAKEEVISYRFQVLHFFWGLKSNCTIFWLQNFMHFVRVQLTVMSVALKGWKSPWNWEFNFPRDFCRHSRQSWSTHNFQQWKCLQQNLTKKERESVWSCNYLGRYKKRRKVV